MNLKQHRRDLRLGCTIQSSTAPALFAAASGHLGPANPAQFEAHAKHLTVARGVGLTRPIMDKLLKRVGYGQTNGRT